MTWKEGRGFLLRSAPDGPWAGWGGSRFLEEGLASVHAAPGRALARRRLAPASREHTLQKLQSFFFQASFGVQAGSVHQGAHIIRIKFERSTRPFHGPRFLTFGVEHARSERERPSIVWIQNEGDFGAPYALSHRFVRFFYSSEYAQ